MARVVEQRVGVVERAAVVRAQHEQAQALAVGGGQHVAQREEVAQRLRHLLVVDVEEAVVHPQPGKGLAVGALALRDLVVVVRKLQVQAAAVDVEALAEQCAAHRRALDVPARAAGAVRARVPDLFGLVGLGRLPQHEVERVLLALGDGHALAGAQLVERLAREPAVAGKAAHRVEHVATGLAVGQPAALERADHRQHLRHVRGGARLVGRWQQADRGDVGVHRGDHLVGQCAHRDAALERAADDLVVDVGDVAHVGHVEAERAQPAVDDVEGRHHPRVTHVAEVVDRHAADVHAHLAGLERDEGFDPAGQRVVDAQRHREAVKANGLPGASVAGRPLGRIEPV